MQVTSVNSTNSYNHQNLVNNPPYITNYPLLEYLQDNKLDLPNSTLNFLSAQNLEKERKTERHITGLLIATLAIVATIAYGVFRKIKNFLK